MGMSSSSHKRRTLGVLVDWTTDRFQMAFLNGIVDFAVAHDVHCICFEGGALASPHEHESQNKNIYQIPNGGLVDGLVILSATIAYFVGRKEMKTFCARYQSLPMLSVSMEIDGIPSLLVDNRTGMRELVVHLLEEHRYRKFAFLAGKKEIRDAVERFEASATTLREHGIPLDPKNIFQGDFSVDSGAAFARNLADPSQLDAEVLVCANDNMALGAMGGLARRGVRIPEQLAITGFDSIDISCYSAPSLTTVRLPIYQPGWTAGRRLLDLIEGKPASEYTLIPTRAVIRESCRCLSCSPVSLKKPPTTGAKPPRMQRPDLTEWRLRFPTPKRAARIPSAC
jgi:DNA-binding LacI/PurR family transcriptional regulator